MSNLVFFQLDINNKVVISTPSLPRLGDLHNNPHGWLLLCLNCMTKLARSVCVCVCVCVCVSVHMPAGVSVRVCNHKAFFLIFIVFMSLQEYSAARFLTKVNN